MIACRQRHHHHHHHHYHHRHHYYYCYDDDYYYYYYHCYGSCGLLFPLVFLFVFGLSVVFLWNGVYFVLL